jgi:hypothetical protein
MDDGTALEKLLKDLGFLEVLNIDRRMGAEHYRFVIPGYPLISYFVEHYKEQYRFTYYYNNTASKSRFLRNIYTKDESMVEEFLIDLMENPLDTPIGNLFMELCDKTNGIFEPTDAEQLIGYYEDHEAYLGNNRINFSVSSRNFLVAIGELDSLVLYELLEQGKKKNKVYESADYKDMSLYITKLSIIYEG